MRGFNEKNEFVPITARGCVFNNKCIGVYNDVLINTYNKQTNKFEGIYGNNKVKCEFDRLHIVFMGEDPVNYVNMVKNAYSRRK